VIADIIMDVMKTAYHWKFFSLQYYIGYLKFRDQIFITSKSFSYIHTHVHTPSVNATDTV
jgi:hypothetical protein